MTALLWAALRDRFGTAVMTFVLAVLAAGFAVAGPTYESAALQAIREAEVAEATVDELVIEATRAAPNREIDLVPPLPHAEGMRTVHGRFVAGDANLDRQTPLTTRLGVCLHLPVVAGRCATAGNEVAARQDMGFKVGQDIDFAYTVEKEVYTVRLTVVGLYAYLDPRDPYWGRHGELMGIGFTGALITTEQTMSRLRGPIVERVDLIASADAFTGDMPSILEDVSTQLRSGTYDINSEILRLSERLDHSRDMLRAKLTAAVVPLVLTCWFVLFLAVAGAIRQRRDELGLVALRGVPTGLRWIMPSLETALPVLLGAIPGYLLGFFAVAAFTDGASTTTASWRYCAAAIGGAVLAGLIAQAAALSAPVHSLLRRVVRRGRPAWRLALELMIATFAVALAYQATVSGEDAQGLSMLAPLFLAMGLGIVAARFTARPAESLGRRALRRGRINLGMSLLTVARRSGSGPVVVILTVVFGLLGFAAVSAVSLQTAWEQRAVVQSAAPRVLSVSSVPTTYLLNAVRAADPAGTQAMAAALLDSTESGWILAVDSQRLPAVVPWPAAYGSLTAQEVSRRLRPQPPTPTMLRGEQLKLRLGMSLAAEKGAVRVTVRLIDSRGSEVLAPSPDLAVGTHEYVLKTTGCAASPCRLDSVEIVVVADNGTKGSLTFDELADAGRWRGTGVRLEPGGGEGLRVDFEAQNRTEMRIYPVSVPEPVPIIGSAPPPEVLLSHTSSLQYRASDAGRLAVTPRVGRGGHLIDMEYASQGPAETPRADTEVWLAPGASEEVVARLRAQGLIILDDRTMQARRELLHGQAPAMTLRFLLVAAGAALLVGAAGLLVIAALERGRPEDGLGMLRAQGLGERTIAAAALGARMVMLGVSLVAGIAATAGSWLLARRVLPPYIDDSWQAPPPSAADLPGVAAATVVGLIVLAAACWFAARVSNRESGLE